MSKTAICNSNEEHKQSEVPQRLDVCLLDISAGQVTRWDIHSLDYNIDGTLATIFTCSCRLTYLFSLKANQTFLSNVFTRFLLDAESCQLVGRQSFCLQFPCHI